MNIFRISVRSREEKADMASKLFKLRHIWLYLEKGSSVPRGIGRRWSDDVSFFSRMSNE